MNNTAILSFSMNPEDGGPYKSVQLFARALDADIFSFSTKREQEMAQADNANIEHLVVKNHKYYPKTSYTKAEAALLNRDLISSHKIFRWSNLVTYKIAKKHEIPYWVVPHGSMDPWVFSYGKIPKELWWHTIGRKYFSEASAVICATERERDKIMLRHQVDNCEVIYWPVSLIDTQDRSIYRAKLRAELGIKPDSKILIYLGRFHTMKRPLETLKRFHQAKLKNTHLLFVGIDSDVTANDLNECIERIGQPKAHVYGAAYGQKKEHILLASDGYISLSQRENFNHSAAESLAAGLPIILSEGNDLGGSLTKVNCGWWLQTSEPSEEIKILQEFDATPQETLALMGQRGRTWASENLRFETFAQKLQALRERCLSNTAQR